jgi:short-subunit dehydrogenase involved in D-alanine esterification of teichoic acids
MNLGGNTVLVTGGASGIGLALASRFLATGSNVVVCGRRESALRAAAEVHPGLVTRACDLSRAEERESLAEWVVDEFPDLNGLDAVVARIAGGQLEIGYGSAEPRRLAANALFDEWFERMNRRPPR